jgi:hypothetical protein
MDANGVPMQCIFLKKIFNSVILRCYRKERVDRFIGDWL